LPIVLAKIQSAAATPTIEKTEVHFPYVPGSALSISRGMPPAKLPTRTPSTANTGIRMPRPDQISIKIGLS